MNRLTSCCIEALQRVDGSSTCSMRAAVVSDPRDLLSCRLHIVVGRKIQQPPQTADAVRARFSGALVLVAASDEGDHLLSTSRGLE